MLRKTILPSNRDLKLTRLSMRVISDTSMGDGLAPNRRDFRVTQ